MALRTGYTTSVTPPSLAPLASRYRLGEVLGAGGMATVYEAIDERLQRAVAVKILRPDMAARADVRARFEAEARAAARLTHPNVVAVFDTGEDDGVPFLVMEQLPGETLADRLPTDDVDWVLRVAGDVLGALGAAHAAGIVHRDVKPGNILIAADGCAKVADFGIAKSLEVAAAADLTSTNQIVGTPAYVAPERILGEPATIRSDLYAVGVVLYEALGGRKPFEGSTPVATAYAIRHEEPPALSSLRSDLPPHVVAAVERAMARDPEARFADAAELAAALGTGVAGGPPTLATPPIAAVDATVVSAPVDATSVLPVAGVAAVASAAPDATPVPDADPVPPLPLLHDRRRLALIAAAALLVALLLLAVAAATGSGDGDTDRATTPGSSTVPTTAAPPPTEPSTTVVPAPAAPTGGGKARGKRGKDD